MPAGDNLLTNHRLPVRQASTTLTSVRIIMDFCFSHRNPVRVPGEERTDMLVMWQARIAAPHRCWIIIKTMMIRRGWRRLSIQRLKHGRRGGRGNGDEPSCFPFPRPSFSFFPFFSFSLLFQQRRLTGGSNNCSANGCWTCDTGNITRRLLRAKLCAHKQLVHFSVMVRITFDKQGLRTPGK